MVRKPVPVGFVDVLIHVVDVAAGGLVSASVISVNGRVARRFDAWKNPYLRPRVDAVDTARMLIGEAYPGELQPSTPTVFESINGVDGWVVTFEVEQYIYSASYDHSEHSPYSVRRERK